jgi:hypothetical protein
MVIIDQWRSLPAGGHARVRGRGSCEELESSDTHRTALSSTSFPGPPRCHGNPILTLIRAISTLIHAMLTLIRAISTLIHAMLTLIRVISTPIRGGPEHGSSSANPTISLLSRSMTRRCYKEGDPIAWPGKLPCICYVFTMYYCVFTVY